MTILRVTWDNPSHAALRDFEPQIEVGGMPLPAHSANTPGVRVFDVPPGTCRLTCDLVYGVGDMVTVHPIVLDEGFTVTATDVTPSGTLHPRCDVQSAAATHAVALIHIDTTFLDVTRAQFLHLTDDVRVGRYVDQRRYPRDLHLPGALRLLVHTGGTPHVWAVYVSEALLATPTPDVGVVVFYAPATGGVTDLAHYGHDVQLLRYFLKTGDRWGATYWGAYRPDENTPEVTGWIYTGQARCRFIEQIDASHKPVIYVHPFNDAGSFGAAHRAGLTGLLLKMLKALRSNTYREDNQGQPMGPEHVFAASNATAISRLAVAGFSLGGPAAMGTVMANSDHVHEAWLMDPTHAGAVSQLSQWAALPVTGGGQPRKVRLIAGDFGDALRGSGLAPVNSDELALDTGDRTVWPAGDGFFRRSNVYKHAFMAGSPLAPLTLAPVGGHSPMSNVTHFYVTPNTDDDHFSVTATLMGNGTPVRRDLPGYANVEIAVGLGYVGHSFVDSSGAATLPPHTERDVDNALHAVKRIFNDGYARRHQWPVVGGQSPNDDPSGFKGYLQLCLEHSGF